MEKYDFLSAHHVAIVFFPRFHAASFHVCVWADLCEKVLQKMVNAKQADKSSTLSIRGEVGERTFSGNCFCKICRNYVGFTLRLIFD